MTRRYGRAPRGRRCLDSAPHGHWQTTTFVGALRRRQLTAPMVTDGPMDGAMFLAYVRQFLCPMLQPGDTVILDNLSSHKVVGVEAAIIASGAQVRFLPPHFAGPEPHRKAHFQTPGTAPQSGGPRAGGTLERNRRVAQYALPKRIYQLLRVLRLCKHLNYKCSKRNRAPFSASWNQNANKKYLLRTAGLESEKPRV